MWFYSSMVLFNGYLKAEESWQWSLAEAGSSQEALQQWPPQELCAPTWTFPRLFMNAGMLGHLLALHINVLSFSWGRSLTQAGWGHKLQNFGRIFEIPIKIASLKDSSVHTLIILLWFSRSVVVSVSINFIVSAADFKKQTYMNILAVFSTKYL